MVECCASCGREIESNEKAHFWNESVVCSECRKRLEDQMIHEEYVRTMEVRRKPQKSSLAELADVVHSSSPPRQVIYATQVVPQKKSSFGSGMMWTFGVLCALAVTCVGSGFLSGFMEGFKREYSKAKASRNAPIDVAASTLVREYRENEVAADSRYRGKYVRVTGNVASIHRDAITDEPVLSIGGRLLSGVECRFSEATGGKLASLRVGDNVSVTGICEGKFVFVKINCR